MCTLASAEAGQGRNRSQSHSPQSIARSHIIIFLTAWFSRGQLGEKPYRKTFRFTTSKTIADSWATLSSRAVSTASRFRRNRWTAITSAVGTFQLARGREPHVRIFQGSVVLYPLGATPCRPLPANINVLFLPIHGSRTDPEMGHGLTRSRYASSISSASTSGSCIPSSWSRRR